MEFILFLEIMEISSVENFKLDADKYVQTTRDEILARLEKFGRLYLEIEWETVKNVEASELISGFPVDANKMIFQEIKDKIEENNCRSFSLCKDTTKKIIIYQKAIKHFKFSQKLTFLRNLNLW